MHTFGGRDTTSAIFEIWKGTVFQRLTKSESLLPYFDVMLNAEALADEVKDAGAALMAAVNGGKVGDKLGKMWHNTYCRLVTNN